MSTVERLSLSQRLLMYNGHTGEAGVLSKVERLSLSLRGCCTHYRYMYSTHASSCSVYFCCCCCLWGDLADLGCRCLPLAPPLPADCCCWCCCCGCCLCCGFCCLCGFCCCFCLGWCCWGPCCGLLCGGCHGCVCFPTCTCLGIDCCVSGFLDC